MDKCSNCGGDLYPSDEIFSAESGCYHVECAEDLGIEFED